MRTRDERWFEATYRAHEHAVRSYAYRRVQPDHVDDIVAEVFTTLWRRRTDAPEHVLPWLYGVAANHVAHLGRSRARNARLTQKLSDNHKLTSTDASSGLSARMLLDALPDRDAELLRLAYWEGLKPHEIAIVLGISQGAARTRLHRARQRAMRHFDSEIRPTSQIITETAEEVLK